MLALWGILTYRLYQKDKIILMGLIFLLNSELHNILPYLVYPHLKLSSKLTVILENIYQKSLELRSWDEVQGQMGKTPASHEVMVIKVCRLNIKLWTTDDGNEPIRLLEYL